MDKDLKPCPFKFIREHYPMTDTNFSHSQVVHLVNEAFNTRATKPQAVECCDHEIIDIRNEVVESGYMCRKCGAAFRAGDHHIKPQAVDVEDEAKLLPYNSGTITAIGISALKKDVVLEMNTISQQVHLGNLSILEVDAIHGTIEYLASRNLIRGAMPDDMVIVPREPTEEMLQVGFNVYQDSYGTYLTRIESAYKAMIKAHEEQK